MFLWNWTSILGFGFVPVLAGFALHSLHRSSLCVGIQPQFLSLWQRLYHWTRSLLNTSLPVSNVFGLWKILKNFLIRFLKRIWGKPDAFSLSIHLVPWELFPEIHCSSSVFPASCLLLLLSAHVCSGKEIIPDKNIIVFSSESHTALQEVLIKNESLYHLLLYSKHCQVYNLLTLLITRVHWRSS